MPICCRSDSPDTDDDKLKARKYGEIRCDLPKATMKLFIEEVGRKKPDMIFWLGDNAAHNGYERNMSAQIKHYKYILDLLAKVNYTGKIYAVMGNHDCYPADQFDIHGNDHKWLTAELAKLLEPWYTEGALKTMREHGYFAQLHENTKLKIIGLNTQAGAKTNRYLLGNWTDPLGQLAWLEKELKQSEANGESVMILGHIGPQANKATGGKRRVKSSVVV
eukprot:TRINITY_DN9540_c0_g2_i1.p1 TRINITY_DN9540_c0_g2~~TRINITY_DN9540_c0_g2_i1.p1  ORF type:complete len:220 (-),score=29.10 TRINITY_DN9540_c0_g2_i1:701-1360(-)